MLLLVLRHPTWASCVAWTSLFIAIMLFFVLRHPTYHHVLHAWVVRCPILSSMYEHVPIYHRDVGIDFPLQSCCSWCYVIQPVYHTLHECVVGCPILWSMYEHVPIFHLIVFDSTPSCILCTLTSHHRVRCSSGLEQLAKHHWHVTYTPCKAPKIT
jgi:hypothetical protein